MGVTIMLDVSKEDVENLAQVLEFTENEFLQNFAEKVLEIQLMRQSSNAAEWRMCFILLDLSEASSPLNRFSP